MYGIDRVARFLHGNRAEKAPHVLASSGDSLSGRAPEGRTSGALCFSATPRLSRALSHDISGGATIAVATRVPLSPRPRGSSAVPASRPTDVAAREETYRAALGQRRVGSSARPTSPRIPRQPFNPFETAAVLF